jgi:hypothetical protein
MSDVSMSSVQSWSDAFHALRAQAEANRGAVTAPTPDSPDAFTFPRTTGQDVLAISVAFDAAVRAHAPSSILQRWLAENDLIATQSPWTLADPYVGNRSYWSTLALVVIELDRAQAPLPAPEVWDEAMKQLGAPAGQLRNAAGAMLITLFTAPTWAEMADRQLQLFRVLRGEDLIDHPRLPIVPRTCNADVLELARYWTEQLARIGRDATDTYARLVYAHWPEVVENVVRFAKRAHPRATYPLNAEFWIALAMLAQSDACYQRPAPWAFQTPPTATDGDPIRRNAEPAGTIVKLPDAKTFEDAEKVQRNYFLQLRGEEAERGVLGTHVPRTTLDDVRQLGAYWRASRGKIDFKENDVSAPGVINRWNKAMAAVDAIPPNADGNAIHGDNVGLWDAIHALAIQLQITDEAPSQFSLFIRSVGHSVVSLPETIYNLPDTVKNLAQRAYDAAKNALGQVAKDATRPLLYAGGAIAGGIILYLLLRRRDAPAAAMPVEA